MRRAPHRPDAGAALAEPSGGLQARRSHSSATRGLGALEWLVVIAVLCVLAAAGLPRMMDFVERRAVEAGAQQLLGDLQYARSEAVQRNEPVAVTAGVDCHVVHLASATASCTAADGATVTPASAALKSVMLTGRPAVSASAENTLARVVFEPVGGTASFIGPDPGSAAASWLLRNSAGTAQARVSVNLGGRASACATGGGHLSSLPDCSP